LTADAAISDDGSTRHERDSARIGCFMHLRDLTLSHSGYAPPTAMELVRRGEAQALERLRERQKREERKAQ
jgi:hypothetical protein